ncbi:MAG: glycoside hydrolase family 5 protein, partial [Spirochaetaceae bacterium]|nr:glycoside hydrolase family 5 protein [Spirochaetaceae bacterium]
MLITKKKILSVPRKVGTAFMAFALINASCVMAFSAPEKNSNSDTPAAKASNEKAVQIVKNMKFGWNLGNTLDATAGGDPANGWAGANKSLGIKTETNWGKPETTQAMIKGLKASGISTIRLPISWHDHIDSNYNIDSAWMNRVKTIVDWAMDEELYVIINIHHDNVGANALKKNSHKGFCPAPKCKEESERYLAKIWQQVAAAFNNGYDEHLIFEVMNEPRLPGDPHEWNWEASCKTCNEAMECINGYNQLCVDTIRATGGNNATRLLMIPSYVAAPGAAISPKFKMPQDPANCLALSVHMYTPYDFAMKDKGGDKTFMQKHKSDLDYWFRELDTKFVKKGIPVVIGEMGATNKDNLA